MPDIVELTRHKMDVDDFHRMAEAGILAPDERTELIEGEIIDMAPIDDDHASAVSMLNHILALSCGSRAQVWPQNPLRLNRINEMQPDLVLLRPRADFYRSGDRPDAADVLLLVEVSASSLRFDQTVKLARYAVAGIGEYWIVNLVDRAVDVYRHPRAESYRDVSSFGSGASITLALAPDITIALGPLFG